MLAELARNDGRSYETGDQLLAAFSPSAAGDGPAAEATENRPDLTRPASQRSPRGWCWATLDALLREPLRNGHSAKATRTGAGLRAFTLSAVTQGDFSERNTKQTVADPEKVKDLWAEPGDIYVERSHTPELVGIARLYNGPSRYAFIPDLFITVRVSTVSTRFIEISMPRRLLTGHSQFPQTSRSAGVRLT